MSSAIRRCLAIVGFSVLFTGVATGQPVAASFLGGVIGGAGFPDPLVNNANAMGAASGSGGGSTGNGLAGGATASAAITDQISFTRLRISGTSWHDNSNGYTSAVSQTALVFELTEAANYSISNTSTITSSSTGLVSSLSPVILTELTGTIAGDAVSGVLSPGTYQLRFAVMAGNQSAFPLADPNYAGYQGLPLDDFGSQNRFSSTNVDWRLNLSAVPAPGASILLGMLLVGARRRR